ncbi:Response regulator receiver protein (modular protein) [Candidatus Sulfopaludibacter sp. SbA6]|nr:Response regulator receiver protein (modular protein) [Candidatus Sulfopaludibacter sp. SbA6]
MVSVAVCDTEPIAIEGLRSLLESAGGLRVVAAETSLVDGMDVVRELRPSLIMLDKAFGIHAVMDLLKTLRETCAGTLAVVWSSSVSEAEALRFLQAGAAGVVRKTASLETLLNCIQAVAAGNTWMEQELLRESDRPVRSGHSPLTARELQVMELVERGMKNKDIAVALGIRTGTVKIHLKHIFEKTGIRGRYGLALSGLKEKGLLSMATVEPV